MNRRGSILLITLAIMFLLIGLVGGFLYATRIFTLNSGWEETDAKVLWLTEAGLQKAIWNLRTPTTASPPGLGENWTTTAVCTTPTGVTESLGDGSYTMVVCKWDFALASNGSSATASSSSGGNVPGRAIDGNNGTLWQSGGQPSPSVPEYITIKFPYPITINKVRFLANDDKEVPMDFAWRVSSASPPPDPPLASTFTNLTGGTVGVGGTVSGNTCTNRTDRVNAASNVRYLRLFVTAPGDGAGNDKVRVNVLEVLGSKITSTGTIAIGTTISRTVVQTVTALDGVTVGPTSPSSCTPFSPKPAAAAYSEPDWVEQ